MQSGDRMKRMILKRRKLGITDYDQRYKLVMSGKDRLVIRPSLNHMKVQVIRPEKEGDRTLVSAHSKELEELGYKGHCGNCTAAYLTGLLCGYKIKKEGTDGIIADIGLKSSTKGANIFAALKGMIDAGIDVPHNKNVLPDKKRIRGEHIAEYASHLDKETYSKQFGGYIARGLKPEELPDHFDEIKNKVEEIK
ncbi:MAG: 50S ribosomal protein L18 [Euryarchaeota archaeon]|nr:50S ribosomal protein L18 [Euryarchaeota archaeon]